MRHRLCGASSCAIEWSSFVRDGANGHTTKSQVATAGRERAHRLRATFARPSATGSILRLQTSAFTFSHKFKASSFLIHLSACLLLAPSSNHFARQLTYLSSSCLLLLLLSLTLTLTLTLTLASS
ncbi:hypothetical protein D6D21_00510 [Aureobasidium pullulans]|uniref:Transmembrane protein n=1 Tax=Aureobasidium pullulans TaxID=5580 RepID=A0AB74JBP5_AURPU|nr:hypothetical protein D6D21_00510 [Aureobasidium pullulans]